jgi:hypothetical protein
MLMSALGAALLLAGCGGGNGRADAAQEAGGAPDGALADGGPDAGADVAASCTALVPDGALTLSTTLMPSSPPPEAPAGGTIENGVYFRTAAIFYVASTCTLLPGAPAATAVRFTATSATAGVIDVAQAIAVPGEQHLIAFSSSYAITGTTMTQTLRCYTLDGADVTIRDGGIHVGDVTTASYTATPAEIRLYAPLGAAVDAAAGSCGTELTVLQKQ